jgi:hypothetical protein
MQILPCCRQHFPNLSNPMTQDVQISEVQGIGILLGSNVFVSFRGKLCPFDSQPHTMSSTIPADHAVAPGDGPLLPFCWQKKHQP